MAMSTVEVGKFAEQLAADYLQDQGYEILRKNYVYKKLGEIDIIAMLDDTVVFVEVRYRTSTAYGTPEASLRPGKLQKIRRTASMWRTIYGYHDAPCRFDVVAIDLVGGEPVLRHLEGCF